MCVLETSTSIQESGMQVLGVVLQENIGHIKETVSVNETDERIGTDRSSGAGGAEIRKQSGRFPRPFPGGSGPMHADRAI